VPNKPANLTQADVARTIRAARQAGARAVEVRFKDGTVMTVRLDSVDSQEAPLALVKEIVL
jgi:hypothetical protein